MYSLCRKMHLDTENNYHSQWIEFMRSTFDNAGLSNIWLHNGEGHPTAYIKLALKNATQDADLQNWFSELADNSQCTFYRMFKEQPELGRHISLLDERDYVILNKFICRNHSLPVAKFKYRNSPQCTESELLCNLCNNGDIGDEFHYLFKCCHFENSRLTYLGQKYIRNANVFTVRKILRPSTRRTAKNLVKFISGICQTFRAR